MPLIVGGGPAGAAAAILLAEAGREPTVVERSATASDALCGGFLSWNSVGLLQRLGVDPFALGGHSVHRARLFTRRRVLEVPLPGTSAGLSRRALDEALLDRAVGAGAQIRRGVTVRAIEGGTVRFADGKVQTPAHLILATGKHDIRGAARPVVSRDPALGLRWRFPVDATLAKELGGAIELHLFRQGYAGLVLQEKGFANLCLAVRQSAFAHAGRSPSAMLAGILTESPALTERLKDADLEHAQAIANIPYGWRAQDEAGRLYRVGDQIGVIPSLAGEGVGIALATGMGAAQAVLCGVAPQHYQERSARRIAAPIGIAATLWSIAEHPQLADALLPLLGRVPGAVSLAMRATRVDAKALRSFKNFG